MFLDKVMLYWGGVLIVLQVKVKNISSIDSELWSLVIN